MTKYKFNIGQLVQFVVYPVALTGGTMFGNPQTSVFIGGRGLMETSAGMHKVYYVRYVSKDGMLVSNYVLEQDLRSLTVQEKELYKAAREEDDLNLKTEVQ
jgi:hypothetical protein